MGIWLQSPIGSRPSPQACAVRPRGLGATSREARRCGVDFSAQQPSEPLHPCGAWPTWPRSRRPSRDPSGASRSGIAVKAYLCALDRCSKNVAAGSTTCLVQMVATRDIKMIVLPRPASKRPRAPLTCRFMCIRCGQVVSSTPDKLAEDMEPHFTDKLRFGCPQVDSRRPNVSIAFFDHGLDDAPVPLPTRAPARAEASIGSTTQRLAHAQRAGRKAHRGAQGGETTAPARNLRGITRNNLAYSQKWCDFLCRR